MNESNLLEGEVRIEDATNFTPYDSLPDNGDEKKSDAEKIQELGLSPEDESAIVFWLDYIYGNWAESTYDDRYYNIRQYANWVLENNTTVTGANSFAIGRYLSHLNSSDYAANTKKSKYYSVKSMYGWLSSTFSDIQDPTEGVETNDYLDFKNTGSKKLEEMHEQVHYLEADEVTQLIENVPKPETRNELIIKLLYTTGLRQSTLVNIEVNDLDREERLIKCYSPKAGDTIKIWYPPTVISVMEKWLSQRKAYAGGTDSDYLFVSHQNEQLKPNRINKIVKKAAENAGLQEVVYEDASTPDGSGLELDDDTTFKRYKITGHTLRHSFAVYFLQKGGDIKTLSELMNHDSLDTTKIYLETLDDDDKEAQMRYGPS